MKNDALTEQAQLKGIYKKYEVFNGKMSWISETDAIWFVSTPNCWGIGPLEKIGTNGHWKIAAKRGTGGDSPLDVSDTNWELSTCSYDGFLGWRKPENGSIIVRRAICEEGRKTYNATILILD